MNQTRICPNKSKRNHAILQSILPVVGFAFCTAICSGTDLGSGYVFYKEQGFYPDSRAVVKEVVSYEAFPAIAKATTKSGEFLEITAEKDPVFLPDPNGAAPPEYGAGKIKQLATRFPQHRELLDKLLVICSSRAAADAQCIAAENQKQEVVRIKKEAEAQRLAQIEENKKAKLAEEQRLAQIEEDKKAKLAEEQRLAQIEEDKKAKLAEEQRLAQMEQIRIKEEAEKQRLAQRCLNNADNIVKTYKKTRDQKNKYLKNQKVEQSLIEILDFENRNRFSTLIQLGVGILILCVVIWVIVFAILKSFDIWSNVRERWRATLPPEERGIEVEGRRESPSERKLMVTGMALVVAGVASLVLPIAWVPAIFWLVSPFLFAANIILFQKLTRLRHYQSAEGLMRLIRIGWFVILYALLGISAGVACLVVLAFGAKEPQFMRSCWNGLAVDQPAIVSISVQTSDSIKVAPDAKLEPTQQKNAEKIAALLTAIQKLELITISRLKRGGNAKFIEETIKYAVNGKRILDKDIDDVCPIEERYPTGGFVRFADKKYFDLVEKMSSELYQREETEKNGDWSFVLKDAADKHDSDIGVQKAIIEIYGWLSSNKDLLFHARNVAGYGGDTDSLCKLGFYYLSDKEYRNPKHAKSCFLEASEKGSAEAAFELGFFFYDNNVEVDTGTNNDSEKAMQYYLRAAEGKYKPAILTVAEGYDEGKRNLVQINYKEAVKWYRKGADSLNPACLYRLGTLYAEGRGVEIGYADAYMYMCLAIACESKDYSPDAKLYLIKLNSLISLSEIEQTEKMLSQFKPHYD